MGDGFEATFVVNVKILFDLPPEVVDSEQIHEAVRALGQRLLEVCPNGSTVRGSGDMMFGVRES